MQKFRIAAILPRFGVSLGGGAEALSKALVEELVHRYPEAVEVEVWSTRARDHRTWENYYPQGKSIEGGIVVRRFTVDARDLETFVRSELMIADGWPLTADEQLDWLSHGVNSRGLYEHIAGHGKSFDLLLFAPYLFATTFWGSLIYPERSAIIPCLHDENYAYLGVFREMFARVRGLIFNHVKELELAEEISGGIPLRGKSIVVGMGFDRAPPLSPLEELSPAVRTLLESGSPYLLYSGRKEEGKNVPLLLDAFVLLRKAHRGNAVKLVLIGAGELHFRETLPEGVVDLGFVTEAEKEWLLARALALVQPSLNESFSIVLIEAWRRETPVLVHARCRVTRAHVEQSRGGLAFSDAAELVASVLYLLDRPTLRKRLGRAGARYVESEYTWEVVLSRFISGLHRLGFLHSSGSVQSLRSRETRSEDNLWESSVSAGESGSRRLELVSYERIKTDDESREGAERDVSAYLGAADVSLERGNTRRTGG